MLYNIAPTGAPQLHTVDEIRAAARHGRELWLNSESVALAAVVDGWCTVVLPCGGICQAWAGDLAVKG